MREFIIGVSFLARGFGHWRRRPALMALGLIPAAIVGVLAVGSLVALGITLPGIADTTTPFADEWPTFWAGAIRIAIGLGLLGAALMIIAVSFTAHTLIVGEPFYARIWRAVENDLDADSGNEADIDVDYGFWRSVSDGIRLVARGIAGAIISLLIGLIPFVGNPLSAVFALLFTGWLLADELAARALTARGFDHSARRGMLRAHRARMLGFGVATQLCFMVPLGAIATMPAAVAGSTALARSVQAGTTV